MTSYSIIFWFIVISIIIWTLSFLDLKSSCDVNKKEKESKKTYSDLLKTQEWKSKRLEILKRDNNKCCYCGNTKNLCVHHKYYLQYPNHEKVKPWNYPDDALITLCNKCHYRIHKSKQIKVYYKKYDTDS